MSKRSRKNCVYVQKVFCFTNCLIWRTTKTPICIKICKYFKEKEDNLERRRYYGLRIGDLVSPKGVDGKEWHRGIAEVINYGGDNNRVEIKSKDGTIIDWVAEWCDIITKVEDR